VRVGDVPADSGENSALPRFRSLGENSSLAFEADIFYPHSSPTACTVGFILVAASGSFPRRLYPRAGPRVIPRAALWLSPPADTSKSPDQLSESEIPVAGMVVWEFKVSGRL
jgi:hypothetical protein